MQDPSKLRILFLSATGLTSEALGRLTVTGAEGTSFLCVHQPWSSRNPVVEGLLGILLCSHDCFTHQWARVSSDHTVGAFCSRPPSTDSSVAQMRVGREGLKTSVRRSSRPFPQEILILWGLSLTMEGRNKRMCVVS